MNEPRKSETNLDLLEDLSEREVEILGLMAENMTNQEIADSLILSLNTVKWYARQIYEKLGVDNRRAAVRKGVDLDLIGTGPANDNVPTYNLPAQITPFWGRQRELNELDHLVASPGCRVLTITGHGGMGKTRLALEFASHLVQNQMGSYPEGIYFVPLADVTDLAGLVSAIAIALNFRFLRGELAPEQQLRQFLQPKQSLLLLDNFEQLIGLDVIHYLADLLTAAPELKLLVTSRVPVNIQGEQIFPLHGLDVPEVLIIGDYSDTDYGSIQLFSDAAHRASPHFSLDQDNLPAIIAICQYVEGMPLAIELAAAWTIALQADEILHEIKSGLDFLESTTANIPERQRSLPVILNASWQFLAPAEQLAIQWLSIFLGGFTVAAAREVADISPQTLLGLVQKNWLQRNRENRYFILELLRHFGSEKLGVAPAMEQTVRDRHSEYYCQWLVKQESDTPMRHYDDFFQTTRLEIENIRRACLWAAHRGFSNLITDSLPALSAYYRQQGDFAAGDQVFKRLTDSLSGPTDENDLYALALLTVWRSTFRSLMGDKQGSMELMNSAWEMIDSPQLAKLDTRSLQAQLLLGQGYVDAASHTLALPRFTQCYELYEQIGDKTGMAYALLGIGRAARNLNKYQKAEEAFQECLALSEQLADPFLKGEALSSMGSIACLSGRLSEAEQLLRQSLQVISPQDNDRYSSSLFWLARTYHLSGRFDTAAFHMEKSLALRREHRLFRILTGVRAGRIYRESGDYFRARAFGEEALANSQAIGYQRGQGLALGLLGSLDLIAGDLDLAYERLQKAISLQQTATDATSSVAMSHRAFLGITALARGNGSEAATHLLAVLSTAHKIQRYVALMISLAGLARLHAIEGYIERAVELYALVTSQPYLQHAHWTNDLIGIHVISAVTSLAPERIIQLEERGRSLPLWDTAKDVLQDMHFSAEST